MYCGNDEAGGDAVALFDEDESFAYEAVNYFFCVVADCNEFYVSVIKYFVLVFEFVNHALEVDFVVVDAEREADCGCLYEA